MTRIIDRRQLLRGATLAGGGLALSAYLPAWAQTTSGGIVRPMPTVSGDDIALRVAHQMIMIDGRESHAIGINGTAPAPLIRLREGQKARLTLTNALPDEQTSIHWHGLILPFQMDGVPGISFPGVDPGESFTYEFPVRQAGTYWYHSHSGLQEQMGHYGPLVIDPAGEDPIASDRSSWDYASATRSSASSPPILASPTIARLATAPASRAQGCWRPQLRRRRADVILRGRARLKVMRERQGATNPG